MEALTAIWDLSYETGNDGAAVDWLRRGVAANGKLPRLHYMMGCSLLAEGNAVTSVALDVGYATPSAFVSAFRRELGSTPGRYFAPQPRER